MRILKVVAALSALPAVSAWGSLGHVTVATIATHLVSNTTEAYFQGLLNNHGPAYLSSIATWADGYKYSKGGHFTGVFHFIDAKDDPPNYCGVDYDRDCKASGCVVSAIQNYTSRVMDMELPIWERIMAAKFVVHFVGDIHQPLHTENVARGGNGIHVKFNGRKWNLHHVWDSTIAEELNGGYHHNPYPAAAKWAAELAEEIESGKYEDMKDEWLKGLDFSSPKDTAMVWATQSNTYVCSHVMPEGPHEIIGQDLAGEYYEAAAPVVEKLIASAGYRLAKWLDLITDSIQSSRMKTDAEEAQMEL
ncbi:uncharacterized protein MKZ38_001199 [Zalerion maritima]|uniref:Nuclease S1 n=1 Tax=Zalerion maritima TaxID=339359 RepID=A0AAD5WVL7_9PEZI|nr:uncharacterized protein MKZ38_001199 [Zalerion maritima]